MTSPAPVVVRIVMAGLFVVLISALALVLVRRGDDVAAGASAARVELLSGSALVMSPDGSRRSVESPTEVGEADVVEVGAGSVQITLVDGSVLEGRTPDGATEPTRIRVGSPPELVNGDALLVTSVGSVVMAGGNRVALSATGTEPSAARLAQGRTTVAGVYRGTVSVDSAGQQRTVPALREIEIATLGNPPVEPAPLRLFDSDAWDRRFLGAVIDLGRQLDADALAYTSTLGAGEGTTAAFYRQVLTSLRDEPQFTDELLASTGARSPGDLLLGAAIAQLGEGATFAERWRAVFAFRDQGAGWGLVAADRGVSGPPLLDVVKRAVDSTPFEFALPPPPPATSAPPVVGPSDDTPAPVVPPVTVRPPPPPASGPLVPTPGTPPTTVPLLNPLIDTVTDLLAGLLGSRD